MDRDRRAYLALMRYTSGLGSSTKTELEPSLRAGSAGGRTRLGEPMRLYPVRLPEELGEWAKNQPGGLAVLVRRLRREAKQKTERQK